MSAGKDLRNLQLILFPTAAAEPLEGDIGRDLTHYVCNLETIDFDDLDVELSPDYLGMIRSGEVSLTDDHYLKQTVQGGTSSVVFYASRRRTAFEAVLKESTYEDVENLLIEALSDFLRVDSLALKDRPGVG